MVWISTVSEYTIMLKKLLRMPGRLPIIDCFATWRSSWLPGGGF